MTVQRRPCFGVALNLPLTHSEELLRRVGAAEQCGYDLFSIMDHPYMADRHEAYSTLAFVLGHTARITGYVGVTNLPLRPAPVLARMVATLSSLSEGRVVLGLGSGGLWDRITQLGVPRLAPADAVAAFEEAILLIKALTGGGQPVTFDGRFYRVTAIEPAAIPTPPIWTGATGPRALRITGRLADGWIPPFGSDWRSQRYRDSRPIIDDAAAREGRDPSEIVDYFNLVGMLTASDLKATRDHDGRWIGGSPREWAEELSRAVLEHGAAGFNTAISNEAGDLDTDTLRRFGEDVIPAERQTIG